jgi:peptide-methionine (S)-S-oxide reductase
MFSRKPTHVVTPEEAMPGHPERVFTVPERHAVLGTPLEPPFPEGVEVLYLGMGCFWGAEEIYWRLPGVYTTAVGYQGGTSPNPTYEETCTGRTGHTEAVLVAYDPTKVSVAELLRVFWENHDPTQGFRQGNDVGTQYRSAIYWTTDEQRTLAEQTRDAYRPVLKEAGWGDITTEIAPAADLPFYWAEAAHQQYLYKVPNGYRCHSKTGIDLPAIA